jgi:hypothetical protein
MPPRYRLGPHGVHDSEKKTHENIVDVLNLKNFYHNDEKVVVIHAQCEGGEAYSRAWCSGGGTSACCCGERADFLSFLCCEIGFISWDWAESCHLGSSDGQVATVDTRVIILHHSNFPGHISYLNKAS